MHPPRALLHDLFSFAVCMGGLLIALFAKIREERAAKDIKDFPFNDEWYQKQEILNISLSILGGVAYVFFLLFSHTIFILRRVLSHIFNLTSKHLLILILRSVGRFIFIVWGGCRCSLRRRRRQGGQRRRSDRAWGYHT